MQQKVLLTLCAHNREKMYYILTLYTHKKTQISFPYNLFMTSHNIHSKEDKVLTKRLISCILYIIAKVWSNTLMLENRGLLRAAKHKVVQLFQSSPRGQRGSIMKMINKVAGIASRNTRRVSVGAITAFTVAFLAACGGGGGASAPSTPAEAPSAPVVRLSIAPGSLTAGGLSAVSPVKVDTVLGMTYTTTGTVGTITVVSPQLVCGSAAVGLSVKVDQTTQTVNFGNATPLPYSASCTVSGTLSGSASVTATFTHSFTTEADPVQRYTDLVITYRGITAGAPEFTNLATGELTLAKNVTKWAGMGMCWRAEKPQADGTIPQACMDGKGMTEADRHMDLYLDPATKELRQYAVAPTGITWVKPTYDPSSIPADRPTWTKAAKLSNGGWLYVDQSNTSVLRMLTASGVDSVVINGTFATDRTISAIGVYNN